MKNDMFVEIAAGGIGGRPEFLHEPQPPRYDKKKCVLDGINADAIETPKKIDTAEELKAALAQMRKYYEPFLVNYAPQITKYNERQLIRESILNGNEKITIPHYGGPVGPATQIYESTFCVDEFPDDKHVMYICFKGADYIAEVYVNGEFVGEHEGFFSPFEFEITEFIKTGENTLKVKLKNDYRYNGDNSPNGERLEGDKLYAATGLGWDDAELGWHHCPAGMGIYNDVYVELRNKRHFHDVFVRPILSESCAEVWVEVENTEYKKKDVSIRYSIYGQNFEETVIENRIFTPATIRTVGMGDSLTEAEVKDILGKAIPAPTQKGINLYKFSVPMENIRLWEPKKPWLYRLNLELICDDEVTDSYSCHFGMREFRQDLETKPYGMFYLNGKRIKLRGANTMGFEQQDVLKGDYNQLIDDILLGKLCNMNFWRLTQRPVQKEVYDYCDMLGFMTQTDLPIFGSVRRPKVCEAIRQAEEMERFIRNHPCNVIISYINEPFPNAQNNPHRHLLRPEMEQFFSSCDFVVRMNNPDRVIKHVDGDYDPPTEGMPDNHCYPTWYNGHGIDIGKLHRGYWMMVKPDWCYGCGEFGTEGLECVDVMTKYYPKSWLKEPFDPRNIKFAQTADLHYFFYDTPESMEEWVEKSQKYQAFATQMMTEAFRRDRNMISFALHLFIDAWPSGWMKTIMDCDRNPKQAYFAYRNSLEPIHISLRTDRFTYFSGENVCIEAFVCNDTNYACEKLSMKFEVYDKNGMILSGITAAKMSDCDIDYITDIEFKAPTVTDRETLTVKAILTDESGMVISHNCMAVEVFEDVTVEENPNVIVVGPLEEGTHEVAGEQIKVKNCGMLPLNFASTKTGHRIVADFKEGDISYWYNAKADMITPLLYATFTADGFTPVVASGNKNDDGVWDKVMAVGVKKHEGKLYVVCQLDLRQENPVAKRLLKNIYDFVKYMD